MTLNFVRVLLKWLGALLRIIRHTEHLATSIYEALATLVLLYHLLVAPKTRRT